MTNQIDLNQADFTMMKSFTQQHGKDERIEVRLFPERILKFCFLKTEFGDEEITVADETNPNGSRKLFSVYKTTDKQKQSMYRVEILNVNENEMKKILEVIRNHMIAPIRD